MAHITSMRSPLAARFAEPRCRHGRLGGGRAPAAKSPSGDAFEELSGTRTVDTSGNNNHGTLVAGAAFKDGRVCGGLNIPNGGARVEVRDSSSLRPNAGVTVEAWIRATPYSGIRVIVGKQVFNGPDSYVLYLQSDGTPHWSCRDGVRSAAAAREQRNAPPQE